MKKTVEILRYGTLLFLYIIPTIFIFNITAFTGNLISFLSFILFSVILFFINNFSGEYTVKFLSTISLLFGIALEIYCIVKIFNLSSDNNSTLIGNLVFTLIIITISFITAQTNGIYSLLKTSNIIFLLPILPLVILPFFFIQNVPYTSYIFANFDNYNILNGIKAALLLFSDICLINIMQKKEKCYNKVSVVFSCFCSLIIIVLTNIILRLIFGVNLLSDLTVPVFSGLSLVGRTGLDEIILFIFSVSFLFREIVKISIIMSLFGIKSKKSGSFLWLAIVTSIFIFFMTILLLKEVIQISLFFNITVFLYLLSYIITPGFYKFILKIIHK